MAVREVSCTIRKRSDDLFSSCLEEDPLRKDSDVAPAEIVKLNVGLPFCRWGSWRHNLAVLAAILSVIFVVVAIAFSAHGFHQNRIEQQNSERFHSEEAQPKQQSVIIPVCSYNEEYFCPALAFFHNPEVHEVATENLMKAGRGLFRPGDRNLVKSAVVAGFKNISFEIQLSAPNVAKELSIADFSISQKDAVLNSMRLMSEPRLQNIGRDIGQAIHDAKSTDKEDLKRHIQAKLQPRFDEIMKLRSELMPESLHQLWGDRHQWTMTLDQENIRVMGPYHKVGKYGAIRGFESSDSHDELSPFLTTTYSLLGGVLEEGRALLDIIELCGHHFGRHLEVPYWVTYLGGSMEVSSEFLSCEHHFDNSKREDVKLNSISALFCPLKFGSQGMDVMKTGFSMDGGPFIPTTVQPSLE